MPETPAENNRHVEEYLSQYVGFPHAPHFAVMLTGAWGIGKTHLIKRFLETKIEKKRKYVYVSLYGLTSTEEVDAALFRAIYPMLDSKVTKIGAHVLKAAMRFARIDLDVKATEVLSKFNAELYVFDDLERCDMPVDKVLGYINEFVEHDTCKVIILANEKEIAEKAEYVRRREKLIGKTLEVQPAFDEALNNFIKSVDDKPTREFLQSRLTEISSVYYQSELNNLRILQQTIWDFERLYRLTSEVHRDNLQAMTAVLKLFFSLSFELKSARIEADDLRKRTDSIVVGHMNLNKKEQPTKLYSASKRYPDIAMHDATLSDELLANVLVKGIFEATQIDESLNRSSYFVDSKTEPAWRAVWNFYERTDAEFERAFAELEQQFATRALVEPGEILHVFGLRLFLSDKGVLEKDKAALVAEGKAYIDDLYAAKRLTPLSADEDLRFSGYGGLGIHENDKPEFGELFTYFLSKRRQVAQDQYPKQGSDLLQEMESNPELYFRRLCYTNSEENLYPRIPILASIDPEAFVATFLKQVPINQRKILTAFKGRYEHGSLGNELAIEKPWLVSVRDLLKDELSRLPRIGQVRLSDMIAHYVEPFCE